MSFASPAGGPGLLSPPQSAETNSVKTPPRRACDQCNFRKVKCRSSDDGSGRCVSCITNGLQCERIKAAKRRGPRSTRIEALQRKQTLSNEVSTSSSQPLPPLLAPLPQQALRFPRPPPEFTQLVGLDSITSYYLWVGIGSETRNGYEKAQASYVNWCKQLSYNPYPASTYQLATWASHQASRGLRPGTIRGYLAALRSFHTDCGWDDSPFESPQLARILRGIRRDVGTVQRRTRLPITLPILIKLLHGLNVCPGVSDLDRITLAAAYSICYIGGLRCGEITFDAQTFNPAFHMSISDVRDLGTFAIIRLPSSKTDPFRKGVNIIVPAAPDHSPVDPLSLLRRYLAVCPPTGPLFRKLSSPVPSFPKAWFVDTLRTSLSLSGIPSSQFSGHSFRRGLATWAKITADLGDDDIRLLGRWSSNAVRLYQDATPDHIASIAARTLVNPPGAAQGIISPDRCWWGDE